MTYSILSSCGFQSSSANACHVLAEIVHRYLSLLAQKSVHMAHNACREKSNIIDIYMALEEIMGYGSLDELLEWADDEGIWKRSAAEVWPSTLRREQVRLDDHIFFDPTQKFPNLCYERVDDDVVCAELTVRRAVDECLEDDLVSGPGMYLAGSKRSLTTDDDPEISLRLDYNSYIPPFLPHLPTKDVWDGRAKPVIPVSNRPTKPKVGGSARPMPRAASVEGVPAADEVGNDGTRKVWQRRAMAYAGVLAEGAGTRSELPSIEICAKRRGSQAKVASKTPSTSSLDAFMHAMDAMADDPTTRTPMLLTSLARSHHANPTLTTSMAAAFKRRRIAHCMADPLRYVPNDSMHGCVHVHPTSPSCAPGPNLLITIPPPPKDGVDEDTHAATAAPVFTPVHPHGRAVALAPPAGSQFPTLSYRHASHLYYAARMLMYPDMQRVFSRLSDPPSILDDHATEQVYHGTTASRAVLAGTVMSVRHRDTLSVMVSRYRGANSILHGSLERLRFHLAAELEAQRRAAQEEGRADEVEEPIRGERIKMPIKGTLVHSWDWRKADPW